MSLRIANIRLIPRTLAGQIAEAFLILLLVFAWIIGISVYAQMEQARTRSRQLLHWNTASHLAAQLESGAAASGDPLFLSRQLLAFREQQPGIDAYVLDERGGIELEFSTHSRLRNTISRIPIERFMQQGSETMVPILGDDPLRPGKEVIFSAAPLRLNGGSYFLYLVLGNAAERGLEHMLSERALISGASLATIGTALLCTITALFAFSVIIKPFRSALAVIFRYQEGDYSARLPAGKDNEVGFLARAVNSLGDAISAQIRELARREHLRKELVANVAHDLRGPLFLIRAGIERFHRRPAAAAEQAPFGELVSGIASNSAMLERLLSELFELSQLEANEIRPKIAPVEADGLCRELAVRFKQRAEDAGVMLEVDAGQELPSVLCDPVLIERALSNLVENALRYVPPGGKIAIAARADGEHISLSVIDTGCGIPASDLPHVFRRNFQISGKEKGLSGLGLAIVQRIVESHGSRMDVESEVDRGTAFSFRLQAAERS